MQGQERRRVQITGVERKLACARSTLPRRKGKTGSRVDRIRVIMERLELQGEILGRGRQQLEKSMNSSQIKEGKETR